jgi:hypothetical protein
MAVPTLSRSTHALSPDLHENGFSKDCYDHHLREILGTFLSDCTADERLYGPSTALTQLGRFYEPISKRPSWLVKGKAGNCFANSTALACMIDGVFYAEGYAIDPELPIPIQHAWAVDRAGSVIDPTWDHIEGHVYFGITFELPFVRDMLERNNGEAGILVNFHKIPPVRRDLRTAAAMEQVLKAAIRA